MRYVLIYLLYFLPPMIFSSSLDLRALGSGLEMTHFFNNKQVLMENVSFQDLTLFYSIPIPSFSLIQSVSSIFPVRSIV